LIERLVAAFLIESIFADFLGNAGLILAQLNDMHHVGCKGGKEPAEEISSLLKTQWRVQ